MGKYFIHQPLIIHSGFLEKKVLNFVDFFSEKLDGVDSISTKNTDIYIFLYELSKMTSVFLRIWVLHLNEDLHLCHDNCNKDTANISHFSTWYLQKIVYF